MNRPSSVSLFCGAGGETMGKMLAFDELGVRLDEDASHAVNHWDLAVLTHRKNYPWINVHQEDITQITAADFGLQHITLLWASPSCVHHSRARGGKPKEEQQRAHAWEVLDRWIRVAHVDVLLIENVPEFQDWGPLHPHDHKDAKLRGMPIAERKGEDFQAFVQQLRDLGYEVEWRILCAADYGDPTIRKRFFLQAVRDGKPITWPDASHRNPKTQAGLFDAALPPWRAAAECIDWSIPCQSIFDRKRPLAEATLRRIAAGVMRYVVNNPKPFLVNLTHGVRLEDLEEPFKTITGANRGEKALCTPYLVNFRGTSERHLEQSASSCEEPTRTVTGGGIHEALIAPTFVGLGGRAAQSRPRNGDEPFGTLTTKADGALIAASLVQTSYGERQDAWRCGDCGYEYERGDLPTVGCVQCGSGEDPILIKGQAPRCLDIEKPLGTVVAGGGKHALVAGFLAKHYTGVVGQEMEKPLGTVTGTDHHSQVAVTLLHNTTGHAPGDVENPLATVTTGGHHGLIAANLIGIDNQSAGDSAAWSAEDPLKTTTTKARHAVVAAFLAQYYSSGGQTGAVDAPMGAVTTVDRHALVTVMLDGQEYVLADIGMRMLEPHELATAMGFPDWYKWETSDGRPLTKRDKVKMIGNAVPVNTCKALIKAVVMERPEAFGLVQKRTA